MQRQSTFFSPMSEQHLRRHIRTPQERIQYLEDVNRLIWDALELAGSIGHFRISIRNLDEASTILQETRAHVEKLIPFKASAFFLVDETNFKFFLADCEPEEYAQLFRDEVDFLINNGTFSWALREERAIIVSSRDHQRLVLHVMSTVSRIRGIFIGWLAQGEQDIPHISLALLSIVMVNSANILESFELYKMIKDINVNLEKTVQERTEQLTYRVKLENLIGTTSTTFINLALDEIDTGIDHALQAIGEFIGADHGYVLLLSEDGTRVNNGYEWCAERVGSQIEKLRGLELKDFPLLAQKMGKLENLHIPSVAQLPLETKADNEWLGLLRIESLIAVSMVSDKGIISLLGFDSVREEKSWSEDTVALIKIVGEIFVNALQRKWAEEERRKLESQLQRAEKMEAIGSLAGGVAHDLNNILGGLVSYPDLLLMDLPEDSPLRRPILTIKNSGKKAAAIVQDLLTLARRGVATTEVANLNDIITDYLASPEYDKLRDFHPGVQVETNLEADLLNVLGSPVHLSKTVMNLISNAAEALPRGGKVTISTRNQYIDRSIRGYDQINEGDYAVLTVADNGIGISSEDMGRIFEPFYTKKTMGISGTGLGMAVVWGTAKDHKGYIDVQSTKGEGTKFDLYFPVTRKEVDKEKPTTTTEEYMGNGETILVVDDVQEQREVASVLLSKLGYSVNAVSSGEEAVEYMKTNSAHLLILDMIMYPGIDGLDTYKKILELNPGTKAIIASGFSETHRVKAAQKLGAGQYVTKPYTLDKIGLAVKTELGR